MLALLLAAVLTLWADFLLRYLPVWAVALVVGCVVLSDIMREWVFGSGLFWSEGLYVFVILLAALGVRQSRSTRCRRATSRWAGGVGAVLAVSAYVRVTSECSAGCSPRSCSSGQWWRSRIEDIRRVRQRHGQ